MSNNSRTGQVSKNISMAMVSKFVEQLMNFVVRTVFIKTLSVEYLGINGLFSNILTFLGMAELGVGSAIIYLMYKPIAENNTDQIKMYMNVYKKLYRIIGTVVLIIGLSLTPFLDFFIAERPDIPENLEFIYVLYVMKTMSTYFFAYKQAIFNADQRGYVVTRNTAIFTTLRSVVEIIFLLVTRKFIVYLVITVAVSYFQNIFIAYLANKQYPYLKEKSDEKLPKEEAKVIKKNVGAMCFHKIGAVVLNSSDNLILSKFIGIITVGIYSNYSTILSVVKTVLWTVFDAIVPSVGNLCASSDSEQEYSIFKGIQLMNLWISGFCTICLGILLNPFITIWIGEDYLLPQSTVWAIIISYYVQTNMRAIEMFRSATGLFYNDRYVPIIQCVINIVVSVIMVQFWGVAGIFVGTTCAVLFTGFWVQPYMVFKHIFKKPLRLYFISYCKCTVVSVAALLATYYVSSLLPETGIIPFLLKMVCCLVIPNVIFLIVYFRTSEFSFLMEKVKQVLRKFKKKRA